MDHLERSSLNCFGGAYLNRMSEMRRDDPWLADQVRQPGTRFVPVWRSKNLFSKKDIHRPVFLDSAMLKQIISDPFDSCIFLGMENKRCYFAIDIDPRDVRAPDTFSDVGFFQDLRKIGARIDNRNGDILVYARGITYWNQTHLFCARCGSPTESKESGHLRVCTRKTCQQSHFPRTDPAIIVLVTHGEKCLLAHQPIWKPGRYSSVAGFVEPGESLEQAVVREVFEETGVHVSRVSYHSSQPWPFPCSIMLGFVAVAGSTKIKTDGREIEDAKWFSRSDIHQAIKEGTLFLPPGISISYNLIANWFDEGQSGKLGDIVDSQNIW